MGERTQFWFNVRTRKVQTDWDKGQARELMGPYATAEEAEGALTSASRRTEEWDEQDRRWRDGDDES